MMFVEPNWGHDSGHASRVLRQVEILPTVLTHSPIQVRFTPTPIGCFFQGFSKGKIAWLLEIKLWTGFPKSRSARGKTHVVVCEKLPPWENTPHLQPYVIVSKFSESYELLSGPTNRRVSIHSTGNQGQRTPFNRGPHTQLHCRSVDWGPSCWTLWASKRVGASGATSGTG